MIFLAMSDWFNTTSIHEVTSNSLVSRVRDGKFKFSKNFQFYRNCGNFSHWNFS